MRKYFDRVFGLATSQTAKDTYILFAGNIASAFFAFLYTLFVARGLSVSDFGVFSAATNLIIIISSFTDLGIASGIVNFVAESLSKGDREKADKYTKAAFSLRGFFVIFIALLLILLAPFISRNLLATSDASITWWVAGISLGTFLWSFFPYVLRAEKKFLESIFIDLSLMIPRAVIALGFFLAGALNIGNALLAYLASFIFVAAISIKLVGLRFIKAQPHKEEYLALIGFSGWLGVNSIISAISGRLDIQMLAAMLGATATGLYSIPARLASFISVLVASFSGVLAPRLAGFGDKEKEKRYLVKSTFALFPIVGSVVLWILIAKPFITILFGQKYLEAVPIFQALTASMIPFILTVPSGTAIVYSLKKPIYIGIFSFFQLPAMFFLNLFFIPRFSVYGPTMSFAIINSILAIYSWVIVIKYYWIDK